MTPSAIRHSDSYDMPQLDRALAATPFAGKLHHFAEIGSTNTYAMEQGAAGAPDGSVYLADAQHAGRGRGAHTWASPPETGLYVSLLLRPALAPGEALWFSLAAGMAALTAIRVVTGLTPDLRWPNDLLIGRRKVAGILTEMHAEATRVRYLVVGIGINVHQAAFPPELAGAATSLALEGAHTTRTTLLGELLLAFHEELISLTQADPERREEAQHALRDRLQAASTWINGKAVSVDEGQADGTSTFHGVTAGLDARGFLQVRTPAGLRTVLSGGVREKES